jgi:hypothetical protein
MAEVKEAAAAIPEVKQSTAHKCATLVTLLVTIGMIVVTLLTTNKASASDLDYAFCKRLVLLLVIQFSLIVTIAFIEFICPAINCSRGFGLVVAYYAADCGVAIFLILLMGISLKNPRDGDPYMKQWTPCAYSCADNTVIHLHLAWLSVTSLWIIWILMTGVYVRARINVEQRELENLQGQIDLSIVPGPGQPDVEFLRRQTQGLSSEEMRSLQITSFDGTPDVLCSICLSDLVLNDPIYKLRCNHIFHIICAAQWLPTKNTCPMCRGVVLLRA